MKHITPPFYQFLHKTKGCLPAAGSVKPIASYQVPSLSKLAVMGGAYGNIPALQACIEHAQKQSCDGFAFIGDGTGCCGHSDETLELIHQHFPYLVAGNHEQKAASDEEDCGCNYTNADDNYYGTIAHQWSLKSLSAPYKVWLSLWPDLAYLETPKGRILLCHGSPDQTNEFLYESTLEDSRLESWLDQHQAIGFICGHSGLPWIRRLNGNRFAMNCGLCGKPDHDHDPAVHFVTLSWDVNDLPVLQIERVEYDHLAWADQLYQEGVDDTFTIPLRNGVWTCGIMSMPPSERILRTRPVTGWLHEATTLG